MMNFNTNTKRLFFMSDLHIGHENIIRLCKRPFSNASEMDKFILDTIKSTVNSEDIVFDLGDMFWKKSPEEINLILDCFNGAKIFKCRGNHDEGASDGVKGRFASLGDILKIGVEHQNEYFPIIMCHYPLVSWQWKSKGALMISGHCHGNNDAYYIESKDLIVDVGFDSDIAKRTGKFLLEFQDILGYLKETRGIPESQKIIDWIKKDGNLKRI